MMLAYNHARIESDMSLGTLKYSRYAILSLVCGNKLVNYLKKKGLPL